MDCMFTEITLAAMAQALGSSRDNSWAVELESGVAGTVVGTFSTGLETLHNIPLSLVPRPETVLFWQDSGLLLCSELH